MKLVNIDNTLAKKYYEMDKTIIYVSLVPYKNNKCIKVYTDNGEPIGDIEESYISEYLNQDKIIMFISQVFDDETGLFNYEIKSQL